jgi:hypothetical protein
MSYGALGEETRRGVSFSPRREHSGEENFDGEVAVKKIDDGGASMCGSVRREEALGVVRSRDGSGPGTERGTCESCALKRNKGAQVVLHRRQRASGG